MNKQVFNSFNSDFNKNAYLNWRTSCRDRVNNFCVLADGYYQACILIADAILDDNCDKKADALVFPMIFDLNQSIELYLKAIQWMLNILLDNSEKFEGGHNLIGLYGTFLKLFSEYENKHPEARGNRKDFNSMTSSLKDYIDELKIVIPEKDWRTMDFTRYPLMSDKKTDHFYIVDSHNITVDVEFFRNRIVSINNSLKSLAVYFDSMIENMGE